MAEEIQRQIRRNFKNASLAFQRGIKVTEFETASYVRLSPLLSSHAQSGSIKGNPNLWILLPDGKRLGFKRIGKNFSWKTLKFRYDDKLSFVPVNDGHVVLYRSRSGIVPVYKIQSSIDSKQRIDFYEKATEIGNKHGFKDD